MPPSILIIEQWGSKPGSEGRVSLGSVPNVSSHYSIPLALVILLGSLLLLLCPQYFHLPCLCLYLLHYQSTLFPLLMGHPHSRVPLHRQTQIHNGYGHYVLWNCALVVGGIHIYLLKYRLHHCHHQWWLNPTPVHILYWLPPHQLAYHPVVKSAQHPPNAWKLPPYLWYK